MELDVFERKVSMILDPYYDREFFTNLIYCIDRKKSIRQIVEASLVEVNRSEEWSSDLDSALNHLFFSYQASSLMRENYQWLPIANSLYGLALHRGDGQKQASTIEVQNLSSEACTLDDFKSLVRKETRRVEPKDRAWASFLFLVENRTTRSQAISILLKESLESNSLIHFLLLEKGLEVAVANGWKASATLLKKSFDQFWGIKPTNDFIKKGLMRAGAAGFKAGSLPVQWNSEWSATLWERSSQSAESVWEFLGQLGSKGVTFEQMFYALAAMRGRALFLMDTEQWPRFTESLIWSDSLIGAYRLSPENALQWLAVDVEELVLTLSHLSRREVTKPSGKDILDGASKNISKDRLVFRLDDAVERGERNHSLELLAAILEDQGLSRTLADRLLLMAAKQDSWTFSFRVLPVALVLTQIFQGCHRLKMEGTLSHDSLYGLLRFLSDVRENSLRVVAKTGTYGDGMKPSQFDVSSGARIVDRFVFNQMRNGQRIKVWPSDG